VDLRDVDIAVVDEADRMADMGFLPAVRRILDQTARKRQTLLFSATLDGDIAVLSRDYQSNPVRHEAAAVESETIEARHHFWLVEAHHRVQHTADLIEDSGRSIVFTRTRRGADRLAKQLNAMGVDSVAMHGGRSQSQRNRALKAFASGRALALIATDVAARGIHIDAVESVIHYDPPADHKDYLHRSGRTARAGATGTVVSLVTGDQKHAVKRLQRDLDLRAPIESPQLHLIGEGGHRMGEPSPARTPRRESSSRPARQSTTHGRRNQSKGRDKGRTQGKGRNNAAHSVYVANLPWEATDDELESLFARYGDVHQTTIIVDRKTGRSRGFGFVDMPESAAESAVKALNGSTFDGRDLTVRIARPRRQYN